LRRLAPVVSPSLEFGEQMERGRLVRFVRFFADGTAALRFARSFEPPDGHGENRSGATRCIIVRCQVGDMDIGVSFAYHYESRTALREIEWLQSASKA
jgi:hypothetical protein